MKFAVFILAVSGIAAIAAAQTDKMAPNGQGEATIYRDQNFQGPAVFVGAANPDLKLSWNVKSIRVRSGTWELCARTRYRPPCAKVSSDEANLSKVNPLLYRVQSMRPLGVEPPPVQDPPAGPSLRGMSSEFFPAPGDRNGRRVLACARGSATANCGRDTADEYCRSLNWGGSASDTMETVGGRIYLADVLCTRTGY